ncbi:hypothetical protein BV22DRAFT_634634 [Leucogyrophana mollusca]|uniref:Uncharacterized protein n=1 Tax=Leucogyrophana mollusca TaxID=85980 RepID=A0ACB8BAX3_9AGAM|nr:hypothetical protein BV22DRAFT_634634 [Leucogyrophana mollusca]
MSHPSYAHFYPGYVPQAAMSSHSVRPQIGFSPTGIAYPGQIPLCDTVIEKMKPLLVAMQEHTSKQLQTVHTEIQALSQATRDARDNTNAGVDALTKLLDKSHKANARQANQIIGHLTGLRDIIGNPAPGVANSSVLDRLAAIEFTVGELLERAKDPEAPKPEIVYHEVGTSPMRQHEPLVKEYADVAVDVESLPSTPIPAPLRNESLSLLHRSNRVQSSIAVQGCVFHSDSPFPNLIDAESQSPDQSIYSPESLVPADWTAVATTPRFAGPLSRAGSPASYSKAYMEKFGTPGEQQGAFSEGTVAALRRAALEHALASPDMTPVVTDPPDPIQMPTTPDAPSMNETALYMT